MMDLSTREGKKFWASFAFIAMICAVLCSLGFWQLQRLTWKSELLNSLNSPDMPAAAMATEDVSPTKPLPIMFFGKYRPENSIFVRNGDKLMVYMLFQTDDGWMVLMRRGAIPAQDIAGMVLDERKSKGSISVTGVPVPRPMSIPFIREPQPDGLLWTLLDWDAIESKTKKYTLAPRLAPFMVAVTDEPESAMNIEEMPPVLRNDHLQYAIFWFVMAGLAALLLGRFLLFPPRGKQV